MLPVKTILCPTDFSGPSQSAVNAAGELARHFACELVLLHVVAFVPSLPPEPFITTNMPSDRERTQTAQEALNGVADALRVEQPALSVRCEVRMGSAPHEIACAALDHHADLMVISTHGHTGWRHLMFGSVAEAVIRLAPCSVLTVREKHSAPDAKPGDFNRR